MLALVLDDSRAMRMIVARILRGLGHDVVEAGNGAEALQVLEAAPELPALACVDWNMPVMDGLEFVQAVRARPEWRRMSLVMVTTESEQAQIVRALAAGAHEYVVKPFPASALVAKLSLLGLDVAA